MVDTAIINFLHTFSALKAKMKDNPRRLAWMSSQSSEVALLVMDLYIAHSRMNDLFETSPSKGIDRVPQGFNHLWHDFKENWATNIEKVVQNWLNKIVENLKEHSEGSSEAGDPELDRPNFDPLTENPADIIANMFWLSETIADSWDDEVGDDQRKAVQAWDWFRDTVGLDLSMVATRWRSVQPIFIPPHVADAYAASEAISLYALLDQAVKAYVYGASGAAIAMCRALTELILKKQYGCDRSKLNLEQIVILAEERYAWMKDLDLHAKRTCANAVLHRNRRATDDEVVNWLKTLKTLIERAPLTNR